MYRDTDMVDGTKPVFPDDLQRRELTATFCDGTQFFYRLWQPNTNADRAVVLFHRGHEHSGRYDDFVSKLDLKHTAVFAWDARGHGRSQGERGDASSFATVVKDADEFVRLINERHGVPVENIVVVGHSVGAVIAAAWVLDYAPPVRAMVLVTPAFRVRLYIPLAIPMLRVLKRLRSRPFVKSYVKSRMLTHDPQQAAEYDRDQLISRQISVNILLGLHDTSTRLLKDAGAIHVPTLVLSAGADWVVSRSAQRTFFDRLGSGVKQMEEYDGFYHAILHEVERERPIAAIRQFIDDSSSRPIDRGTGPYSSMAMKRPSFVARTGYAVSRAFLKSVGRLSDGVRLGWKCGFDSGQSLDHVYRNQAQGLTPLGRLIDRIYLNSPGWCGIRQRKANLQQLLERAIHAVHRNNQPVRVLDIASGPGRYVLDVIGRLTDIPISALMRDRDEQGLAEGRQITCRRGIESVIYESGDAFDPHSLASIWPQPTIAIASGLYELFSDNAMISRSLGGLHAALVDGGLLIYTNQPWHPQLAFIANVLSNREHKPWIMRCRSQLEIDNLVRDAGFQKVATELDDKAIFSVSLARKIAF